MAAMLTALQPPKRARPLVAVVGINDATETNDYLMPAGILRRADIDRDLALILAQHARQHAIGGKIQRVGDVLTGDADGLGAILGIVGAQDDLALAPVDADPGQLVGGLAHPCPGLLGQLAQHLAVGAGNAQLDRIAAAGAKDHGDGAQIAVGHGLGGKYDFYKFTTEGRFYKGLGNGHILALRLQGGYIDGDVSYGNLFDLGGSNTLRGYEDDQFKGKKMYAATLEYRFPIAKKVQGVLFTDGGSTWGIDNGQIPWYEDDDGFQWSCGVGLRLQTPIGPIRLDYGHGDKNKFHFSFGTQF